MGVKNVIFVVSFIVSVVMCLPRDSTAVHENNVIVQQSDTKISDKVEISTQTTNEVPAIHIPGRISCSYEEATEEDICLEHCLPKGYSYGLCVSKTCSCI